MARFSRIFRDSIFPAAFFATAAQPAESKPEAAPKVGGVTDANNFRTYRVAAIQALDLTEETFARPKDFDLAAYWTAAAKAFETSVYTAEAKLRLSPQGMKRLSKFPPAVVDMATRTKSAPDKLGGPTSPSPSNPSTTPPANC